VVYKPWNTKRNIPPWKFAKNNRHSLELSRKLAGISLVAEQQLIRNHPENLIVFGAYSNLIHR